MTVRVKTKPTSELATHFVTGPWPDGREDGMGFGERDLNDMDLHEIEQVEIGLHEMSLDETGLEEIGPDEISLHEMGLDGTGLDDEARLTLF